MNASRYRVLKALDERPLQMKHLKSAAELSNIKPVLALDRLGWVVIQHDVADPWVLITRAGHAALKWPDKWAKRPRYAGGEGWRRAKAPQHPVTPMPGPGERAAMDDVVRDLLALPAPEPTTMPPTLLAEMRVTLEVPVIMAVGGKSDGQAVKQAVEEVIAKRGLGVFIQGWRLMAVLDEKHNTIIGPSTDL
jgi:hypothetical protein